MAWAVECCSASGSQDILCIIVVNHMTVLHTANRLHVCDAGALQVLATADTFQSETAAAQIKCSIVLSGPQSMMHRRPTCIRVFSALEMSVPCARASSPCSCCWQVLNTACAASTCHKLLDRSSGSTSTFSAPHRRASSLQEQL